MTDPKLNDAIVEMLENFGTPEFVTLVQNFNHYSEDKVRHEFGELAQATQTRQALLEPPSLKPDLRSLAALPEGTLGKAYYNYLSNPAVPGPQNYCQQFQKGVAPEEAELNSNFGQLHDLWHVLIGADQSQEGELKVTGFALAQSVNAQQALFATMTALETTMYHPEQINPVFDALTAGWGRGRKAKGLAQVDWSQEWSRSLDEVRRGYNLY